MRKVLIAFSGVLVGCYAPAYRAPEVPVPSAYSVTGAAPAEPTLAQARAFRPRADDNGHRQHITTPDVAGSDSWAHESVTDPAAVGRGL